MNIFKWLFSWKCRFFTKKVGQVARAIIDLEFKLFKIRELREERRKQYDRTVEQLDALSVQIKNPANKEETIKSLEDKKKEQDEYQKHLKEQLDELDLEIHGDKTRSISGVIDQIESMRELMKMYKDYMRFNV